MKIFLDVPYEEKEEVKALGAIWDPRVRSWAAQLDASIGRFSAWLENPPVICESLYLLRMHRYCWKDGHPNDVVLLATDRAYLACEEYRLNTNFQILTYVRGMPEALAKFMRAYAYYPSYSNTIRDTYFVNHCRRCGSIQGDHFLHDVPKDAFYRRLFYSDEEPVWYSRIRNRYGIVLWANPPLYDEVLHSYVLIESHLRTGIENRASIGVSQKRMNHFFEKNMKDGDIVIEGL